MAEDRTVKRSFKDHDTLGREKFANFLIEVMKNGQSEEGSYTLAIDAPYGSGKTWFLQMLENKINEEYASTKQEIPLVAVRYDAWKYDYFDEPLEPLVEQIMQAPVMVDEKAFEGAKGALKKAIAGVKALAKFDWTDVAEDLPGWMKAIPAVVEAYEAGGHAGTGLHEEARKLKRYESALDNLQDVLHQAAVTYGEAAKLVVIIDELDRCRPDFSIRTLEVTKHLLASENVVFLYAVDMKQLGRAVETMYGAGMNADGYLLRFFNHIGVLPTIDKTNYLLNALRKFLDKGKSAHIANEIYHQKEFLKLTYRDIDRIVSSFHILVDRHLKQYIYPEAYLLYFYLLTLKYVKRKAFDYLVLGQSNEEAENYFKRNDAVTNEILRKAVAALVTRSTVQHTYSFGGDLVMKFPSEILEGHQRLYYFQREGTQNDFTYSCRDKAPEGENYAGRFSDQSYIDGIIFYPDVVTLFKLPFHEMTIGEYLHQELEMYNYNPDD